jgi:hypothetical protein
VRPIRRPRPPFSTQGLKPCPSHTCFACAAGQRVRFEIGRVDHDRLWCGGFGSQSVHHSGEDAHVTPPLPTVVEGLGWAIFLRGVTPSQAIAIDEYNSAQNAPIIHTRLAMALRKERTEPRHLVFVQPVKIAHNAPKIWELESRKHGGLKPINGSGA